MKKRNMMTAVVAMTMAAAMSMTAFAGWQTGFDGTSARWWYDNNDGTWLANGWHWVDDNKDGVAQCYYFDADGYVITSTTTPDGYTVNATGEWTVDGAIQNKGEAVKSNTAANTDVAGTAKSLDDYGYTNGLNDLIYDLPNLTRSDVIEMLGEDSLIRDGASDGSGISVFQEKGTRNTFFVNDNDGTINGVNLYFDRAFESLTADDVKNDTTVKRVVSYLENHGFNPHVYAANEAFVFRIQSAGKTLQISSLSTGRYKSGWADLAIKIEN